MRYEWPASYLDGQTAIRHRVTLRLAGRGLEVALPGGRTSFWPYAEIRQTQGFYKGEEVRLERGGQLAEALLIPDVDFLVSLNEVAPSLGRRFHDPGRRPRRLRITVLAAVAVVAIAGALYLWGIPVLAAWAAPGVPVAWEEELGRSVIANLAPPEVLCMDLRGQRLLDSIVARLAAATPRSPYVFRVLVVNQPEVNALAAPGGYIVLFRGLLDRARRPEELAGVLAHEMQHVIQRHSTQALIQHTSTGLLLAALTGDMTGPLAYGLAGARVLAQLQYSRRAEAQADEEGARMLRAARVDPTGLIDFLEGIGGEGQSRRTLDYFSTHPGSADRIQRLRAIAAHAGETPQPLLSDADWAAVKKMCAPAPSG